MVFEPPHRTEGRVGGCARITGHEGSSQPISCSRLRQLCWFARVRLIIGRRRQRGWISWSWCRGRHGWRCRGAWRPVHQDVGLRGASRRGDGLPVHARKRDNHLRCAEERRRVLRLWPELRDRMQEQRALRILPRWIEVHGDGGEGRVVQRENVLGRIGLQHRYIHMRRSARDRAALRTHGPQALRGRRVLLVRFGQLRSAHPDGRRLLALFHRRLRRRIHVLLDEQQVRRDPCGGIALRRERSMRDAVLQRGLRDRCEEVH